MRARMALSELMKTVPYGFRIARCSVCTRHQKRGIWSTVRDPEAALE
jgi:hypothetical protein